MKKQPTRINFKWQMCWIENGEIAHRPMKWFEYVRYFPRIIIQEWVTGYKFPKI
jgi:hypothetical protein